MKKAAETAMCVGFFACVALYLEPTWPVSIGVVGICISFSIVCLRMMR